MRDIISWGECARTGINNCDLLAVQLSQINSFIIQIEDLSDDNEYSEPPAIDTRKISHFIFLNFPEFSCYNISSDVTTKIAETSILVGDSRDDLLDIIKDFKEILWYLENTSTANAIWHLKFGYSAHWGKHLIDLLSYLFCLKNGI